jgi:phosphoglycolate phosphatase
MEIAAATPEQTWYIGDTATDMRTAANAGLRKVGVLWGFRDRAELEAAGADVIINEPREIRGL